MPADIRKVVITEFGGPTTVRVEDAILPDPPADHVQVKISYSGFSGSDINMRLGVYPFQKKAPLTPGYCLVGTVHVNGARSTTFRPGDRVACLSVYDSEATFANLPEQHLIPVPEGLDLQHATALVLDWNTAYAMVTRVACVSRGQMVFVHGLSGAVGYAVMTLCQRQGAHVYGTASERNHAALRELGATPFSYSDKKWIAEMKALQGVQAVFDPLGFESWDESYSIVSVAGGIMVGYGGNSLTLNGLPPRSVLWPTIKLLSRNLMFWSHKSTRFYYISRDDKTFKPDLKALFDLALEKSIAIRIKRVFSLEEVPVTHRDWTKLTGMGSVVVKID